MRKINTTKSFIFLLLVSLLGSACQGSHSNQDEVQIRSASNNDLLASFEVEIADEPSERSMGLMFRNELAPNEGMLFIFDGPVTTTFWMRNTPLPLDIIFIDENRKIITIGEGVPFSEAPIPASGPFLYVLEINAGRSAELGIQVGDQVEF